MNYLFWLQFWFPNQKKDTRRGGAACKMSTKIKIRVFLMSLFSSVHCGKKWTTYVFYQDKKHFTTFIEICAIPYAFDSIFCFTYCIMSIWPVFSPSLAFCLSSLKEKLNSSSVVLGV